MYEIQGRRPFREKKREERGIQPNTGLGRKSTQHRASTCCTLELGLDRPAEGTKVQLCFPYRPFPGQALGTENL